MAEARSGECRRARSVWTRSSAGGGFAVPVEKAFSVRTVESRRTRIRSKKRSRSVLVSRKRLHTLLETRLCCASIIIDQVLACGHFVATVELPILVEKAAGCLWDPGVQVWQCLIGEP